MVRVDGKRIMGVAGSALMSQSLSNRFSYSLRALNMFMYSREIVKGCCSVGVVV